MRRYPAPVSRRRPQRGAAILLAMLILTLVATLAAGMVWLQWRGIEVESAERARGQGEWLLNGALDWGRLILKSDVRASPNRTDLTQPWAMPLAESRLSSFLASDQNHADDSGPDAFLSGQITDAQSKYNLFRLYGIKTTRVEMQRFELLCEAVGVPVAVADQIGAGLTQSWSMVQNLEQDPSAKDSNSTFLMPTKPDDLRWYGVDPAALQKLLPYVELLPADSTVNVNTASAEVLMASIPDLSRAQAQTIVQQRQSKPFDNVKDARWTAIVPVPVVSPGASAPTSNVDVKSAYFEITGQLRYEQHVLRERTLVQRSGMNDVFVLRRERLAPDAPL